MTVSPITRPQIAARLAENSIPFVEMPLQDGISVIVSQRGGRIYGPFLEEGQSLFWVSPVFRDAASFAWTARDPNEWNLGGDRIWIAPEIQYLVTELGDPANSCVIPPGMDPGNWSFVARGSGECRLAWDARLEARFTSVGPVSLSVARAIRPAPDPLRDVSAYRALRANLIYGGYEQVLTLDARSGAASSAVWSIAQVRPGGTVFIPCLPEIEATTYLGSPPAAPLRGGFPCVRLEITARRMFKTGYKSAYVVGRIGYANRLADGRCYILIRAFSNQPSADYLEAPATDLRRRGDSIFVYNDDGAFGDFGEIECMGQAVGPKGRSRATDVITMWCYAGTLDAIKAVGRHLLGIEVEP